MFQGELPDIEDWGLIAYRDSFEKQKIYVDEVLKGQRKETIVFCHHEPVVTLGRGTQKEDVFSWQGERVEVNRGGRATYHGPGQVLMYPIIDLMGNSPSYLKKKIKSLHAYMRQLEQTAVLTLRDYGVQAQGRCQEKSSGINQATGVWVGHQKLASIGIAVKRWITCHGMAINIFKDEKAFQGIKPCGFAPETMVCLQDLTDQRIKRKVFQKELASNFILSIYIQ